MSLWHGRALSLTDLGVPPRSSRGRVTSRTARRNSAVWACLDLRAGLISAMPVDAYREVAGLQVEVPKPPVLVTPGGREWKMQSWLYAGQQAKDSVGNNVGLITARDGLGLPAVIELQDMSTASALVRDGRLHEWRFGGKTYDPADVWHERQYEVAGSPLGLSPIAHAAFTLEKYSSAQEFAREWFDGKAVPRASLRNVAKVVPSRNASEINDRFRAVVETGGVFVHGNDWEYKPIQGSTMDANFLASMDADLVDVCRYLRCPADLIDAVVSGQSVTYANITQRNLQLLIHNLSGPVKRTEDNLSDLLPRPRFVKLNSDAILRMDPETRARVLGLQVKDRLRTPSEARAIDDYQPYADADYAEFDRLFGNPNKQTPTTAATGAPQ